MTDPFSSTLSALFAKKFGIIAGGFIGSIISLKFVSDLSMRARAFNVFCGVALAYFTTEAAVDYFGIADYRDAVACLIGLFGLSLCAAVFKAINDADLWNVFKSKLGIGGDK